MAQHWSIEQLEEQLVKYESALREAGMTANTVQTYVDRPRRFLKWLIGEYVPNHPTGR